MSTYTPPPFGQPDPSASGPTPPQPGYTPAPQAPYTPPAPQDAQPYTPPAPVPGYTPAPQAPQAPQPYTPPAPQPFVTPAPQDTQSPTPYTPPAQPYKPPVPQDQPAQPGYATPTSQSFVPPMPETPQAPQPFAPQVSQIPQAQPYAAAPQGSYAAPQAPYAPQAPQAPYTVAPTRNRLLFVVSILIIIGGAINLIAGFGLVAAGAGYGVSSGVFGFAVLVSFVAAIYMLIIGILGCANSAKPEKGGLLVNLGYGSLAIPILNIILAVMLDSFTFSNVLGFLLPILYLIGAFNLKKQA